MKIIALDVHRTFAQVAILENGEAATGGTSAQLQYFLGLEYLAAGRHDDMVDCMTMAIIYMRDSWNLIHPDDADIDDFEDASRYKAKKKGYWSF